MGEGPVAARGNSSGAKPDKLSWFFPSNMISFGGQRSLNRTNMV